MNLTSLWSCRRFNRRLRSSLPGLHRAEGCEKPYGGTTIQGNMKQTAASHSLFFSLSWNSSFSVRRLLSPPLSSWTSVSSRTRPSTGLSVSKAASDQCGCSWWQRERSGNFASAWWPFRTPHPTPLKCTECCTGRNTPTSSWGKRFPETFCCGEQEKACGLCGEHWLNEMRHLMFLSATHEWADELCLWELFNAGTQHRFWQLKIFIWLIYFHSIYNFIKNCWTLTVVFFYQTFQGFICLLWQSKINHMQYIMAAYIYLTWVSFCCIFTLGLIFLRKKVFFVFLWQLKKKQNNT